VTDVLESLCGVLELAVFYLVLDEYFFTSWMLKLEDIY
jgi:hypothetical protein